MEHKRGNWGSNFGFLMAAVGSAVGLGNLWGFPYKMGANGGFAFLVVYLLLVLFVGFVVMVGELALGRKSGLGVVGTYKKLSKEVRWLGWLGIASAFLIMSFYTVLGGYVTKYIVVNLGDIFGASWGSGGLAAGDLFNGLLTNQAESIIYSVIFLALTCLIVMGGISGGIEKFTKYAMPALFVMLLVVIIRSVTLPGAGEGLRFMLVPNLEPLKEDFMAVISSAGGQMFFSLSLGMGITVTYGSYMKKDANLERSALIIPFADTVIAIMASLAIMPAVFATGQEPTQGPGLLFVTLQSVFSAMGKFGPIFGFIFYMLVFIAAITSSIALLEAICSTVMDKRAEKGKPMNRKSVVNLIGLIVCLEGVFVALDGLGENGFPHIFGLGTWLDTFDLISEGILMPLGACYMAIILPTELVDKEVTLNNNKFRTQKFFDFCIKFCAPLLMVLVLLGQIDTFFGLEIFS